MTMKMGEVRCDVLTQIKYSRHDRVLPLRWTSLSVMHLSMSRYQEDSFAHQGRYFIMKELAQIVHPANQATRFATRPMTTPNP